MASPALASLLLFTRLDSRALLEHEARRHILDRLAQRPGMTVAEMARALCVHYKTALHHARHLERQGRLVFVPEGRVRRGFLPGSFRTRPAAPPRVVCALQAVRRGAGTPAALARALGIPRGSAGSLLEALAKKGLLVRAPEGWRLAQGAEGSLLEDQPFS